MSRTKMRDGQRIPLTDAENAERDAREAAWAAGENDRLAKRARAERDRLLAACDWRFMVDSPAAPDWATYRQALRDIPQQDGFPNDITWPTEPS